MLGYVIFAPGFLEMEYKFDATKTAKEAFETGQVNCLSFAHLFIALSRYAGFKTSYQEVKLPPTWEEIKGTGSYYFLRHVNVNIRLPYRQYTVDINAPKEIKFLNAKTISDDAAFAQHLNNIAVDYMQQGDKLNAFRHYKKAILLAPKDASLWTNLGTLYRRYGFYKLAEAAYYHALDLNGKEYTAMSNLAVLYQQTGESNKQEYYLNKIEKIRKQNPYNYFYLAREAYEEGDYSLAEERLFAAINKEKGDVRFYLLMVLVQQKLNNIKAVLKYQKIAEDLSDENEQYISNMKIDLD
jgi:Tfp pilus assembly protein PilF